MTKSYSTLFPQVVAEINKRTGKEVSTSGSRFSVQPSGEGGSIDARGLAEIITTIATDLANLIKPYIISGFDVTATTPPSDYIQITAGRCTSNGKIWEIESDTELLIPFDSTTTVFYIVVYNNAFEITRTHDDTQCEICKIIVPHPEIYPAIVDDKPESGYNAWIVSAKDIVYDEDQEFDDASVEKLRDIMGPVLADNLIGNLRLSENLKITNTQGTLAIDSSSVKILTKTIGGDDRTLAKFDRNGTFFYDESGAEVARFSADDAKIGNILVTKNTIGSSNFQSELRGFRIEDSGYAEFEDVRVRGRISSSVFEYDKISAVGGKLLIGNSTVLTEDITSSQTTITVEDSVFSVNEILRMKIINSDEYLRVTNISQAPTYTVVRGLSGSSFAFNKGTAIVSMGTTDTGFISLDAVSQYAPFIDINLRNSLTYSDYSTKVRLGNLAGITDSLYGVLTGYGLYSDNVYLRGKLYAPEIKTAITDSRIELTTDYFRAYDNSSLRAFQILLESEAGVGDPGDIILGDISGNHLIWDASAATLTFVGSGGAANLGDRGYASTVVFTATDTDTASWSSGSIKLTDGTIKNIDAGNTGNISTITYVYYDDDVSQTVLQTTTTYSTAIGVNKLLLAIVELGDTQVVITLGGARGTTISGNSITTGTLNTDRIATNSIHGNKITASTIAASKLSVSQLSAIAADLGFVTAGTVTGATLQTASGAGSRVVMDTNALVAYDDTNAEVFKVQVSGENVGNVTLGNTSRSYMQWTRSGSGYLTIQTKPYSIVGSEKINIQNNTIVIYDEAGNERVILGRIA